MALIHFDQFSESVNLPILVGQGRFTFAGVTWPDLPSQAKGICPFACLPTSLERLEHFATFRLQTHTN